MASDLSPAEELAEAVRRLAVHRGHLHRARECDHPVHAVEAALARYDASKAEPTPVVRAAGALLSAMSFREAQQGEAGRTMADGLVRRERQALADVLGQVDVSGDTGGCTCEGHSHHTDFIGGDMSGRCIERGCGCPTRDPEPQPTRPNTPKVSEP